MHFQNGLEKVVVTFSGSSGRKCLSPYSVKTKLPRVVEILKSGKSIGQNLRNCSRQDSIYPLINYSGSIFL